jgi:hypothetical protein
MDHEVREIEEMSEQDKGIYLPKIASNQLNAVEATIRPTLENTEGMYLPF